jgi:hypothetical protein
MLTSTRCRTISGIDLSYCLTQRCYRDDIDDSWQKDGNYVSLVQKRSGYIAVSKSVYDAGDR